MAALKVTCAMWTMTEWVRVPVDTDSMSTINTGTFRGIGTQSSSITDRNDNEDYCEFLDNLKVSNPCVI